LDFNAGQGLTQRAVRVCSAMPQPWPQLFDPFCSWAVDVLCGSAAPDGRLRLRRALFGTCRLTIIRTEKSTYAMFSQRHRDEAHVAQHDGFLAVYLYSSCRFQFSMKPLRGVSFGRCSRDHGAASCSNGRKVKACVVIPCFHVAAAVEGRRYRYMGLYSIARARPYPYSAVFYGWGPRPCAHLRV
jgi:hypothetical protein